MTDRTTTATYSVSGMTCAACTAHVSKALLSVTGVSRADANLLGKSVTVTFDGRTETENAIKAAVEKAGFAISGTSGQPREEETTGLTPGRRVLVSALLTLPFYIVLVLSWTGNVSVIRPLSLPWLPYVVLACLAYAVTAINRKIPVSGLRRLFNGPDMNSLVTVGLIACLTTGTVVLVGSFCMPERFDAPESLHYFESVAMILTLVSFGHLLQAKAEQRTVAAVTALINLSPPTAVRVTGDKTETVNVSDVRPGDILIVKAGDSVPVDGPVVSGSGSFDESMMTGESLPAEKNTGDFLTGATVCTAGYVTMRATNTGKDTKLSRIVDLMNEAASAKTSLASLADKISGYFVPVISIVAAATLIVWILCGASVGFAVTMATSVLVIACPCALVLATPTAIMTGTARAARSGILVKNALALETSEKIDTVVFDKTGTLTNGKHTVSGIVSFGNGNETELLALAASVEAASNHPIARSVVSAADDRQIRRMPVKNFTELKGFGVTGTVGGKHVTVSNSRMAGKNLTAALSGETIRAISLLEENGRTVLIVSADSVPLGYIELSDGIREGAKEAVDRLKAAGITVIMMTGDSPGAARHVADRLGITDARSAMLPEDKLNAVKSLKASGRTVLMAGDGINDSPSLTASDIGCAVAGSTDIAVSSADIIFLNPNPLCVPEAITIARQITKTIRGNICCSFIYNTVTVSIACGLLYPFFGIVINPAISATVMSLSSLTVIFNSLRLVPGIPGKRKQQKTPYQGTAPALPACACSHHDDHAHGENHDHRHETNMKKTVSIEGMHCIHCANAVEKAISEMTGVSSCKVDLVGKKATVEFDGPVTDEALAQTVTATGFTVTSVSNS